MVRATISMHPHVFVVLTTYNGIDYIGKQLDSLLSQTCPCHIYIFDDGSTDGTIEFIQAHYLWYPNLQLTLNKTRLGYVKNFEKGVRHTYNLGAHLVALCDQDDVWHPDRIKKMKAVIDTEKSSPTLIYSDLQMIDDNETLLHPSYLQYRGYSTRSNDSQHGLATALGQNGVMGNTILMNRLLVKRILPFPKDLHVHDYWISLIAQLYGRCIFIPEALVSYRIHNNNSSNSVHSLANPKPQYRKSFWKKHRQRDYPLAYKEDSRDKTLRYLLDQRCNTKNSLLTNEISRHDKSLIIGFLHYLNFDKPRWYLACWMLKHRFIRKSWKLQLRFVYRVFATKRYSQSK